MQSCLLDTSYLITLSDSSRQQHETAKQYFKSCIDASVVMHLSTIAIAEFSVNQAIPDFIYANCIVLPFNVDEAIEAGRIHQLLKDTPQNSPQAKSSGDRVALKDDIKLIAQAHRNAIEFVLTEDGKTFKKTVARLTELGNSTLKVALLVDGFDETIFTNGQHTISLQ